MARPKLSPETKRAAQERAKVEKDHKLASTALASLPESPEKRREIFAERKRLKADAKSFSAKVADHEKRMKNVFGMLPKAVKIVDIFESCKDGEYEAVLQEVKTFLEDQGRPFQLSFELKPGKGVQEDTGPLFDKTTAGQRDNREPGQARPASAKAPAPQPSPGIPLEEAQAKFEEASVGKFPTEEEIAAKNAAIAAQKAKDEAEFEQPAPAPDEGNVVQLSERRKPGRPRLTPEQKAKVIEERKAAKQAAKKGAAGNKKAVKAAADKAEAKAQSPKPTEVAPSNGADHEPAPHDALPPPAPDFEEEELPTVMAAPDEKPSGGYAVLA